MEAPAGERRGGLRTVLDGVFVGFTNPKGLLFSAAVLPQFVNHSAGRVPFNPLQSGTATWSVPRRPRL